VCPLCLAENRPAFAVSGRGTVYSFTVANTSGGPGFDDLPYAIVVVELQEQPGLLTVGNISNCNIEELLIGMDVEVEFEHVDDMVLPQWRRP